jgi:hypothetical protein
MPDNEDVCMMMYRLLSVAREYILCQSFYCNNIHYINGYYQDYTKTIDPHRAIRGYDEVMDWLENNANPHQF